MSDQPTIFMINIRDIKAKAGIFYFLKLLILHELSRLTGAQPALLFARSAPTAPFFAISHFIFVCFAASGRTTNANCWRLLLFIGDGFMLGFLLRKAALLADAFGGISSILYFYQKQFGLF